MQPAPCSAECTCPGVLPCFAALAFANGFCCLGSFEQVEYLARYQQVFDAFGWPESGVARQVATWGLCTGRCLAEDGQPIWPLDVVLGTAWRQDPVQTLGELVGPLVPRMLSGS